MTQTYGAAVDVLAPLLEDSRFDVETYVRGRLRDQLVRMGAVPTPESLDSMEFAETYELPRRWWQRLLRRRPHKIEVRGRRYRMTGVSP